MATAGSIVVDLLMKTGSFETDSKRAERRMKQLEREINRTVKRVSLFGVAMAGSFAAAMKSANSYMAEIGMAAQRTSVSAKAFSELTYAAEQASLSQGELERVLRRSTEAINHGINETGKQAEALSTLGISAYDASGNLKTADQMLRDLADGFSKLEPGARKTGLVLDLFGQQLGQKVIPLLNQGSDGFDQMAQRASELGIVVDDEAAAAAIDFETNLDDLKKAGKGLAISLAQDVIPWLSEMTREFQLGIKYSNGFFDALMKYGTASPFKDPEEQIASIDKKLKKAKKNLAELQGISGGAFDVGGSAGRSAQLFEERIKNLQQERAYWSELAKDQFDADFVGPHRPVQTLSPIKITGDASGDKKSRTKSEIDEGQRLIQQMNERIALLGKETEYEQLLAKISVESITFRTEAEQEQALALAQTIDVFNEAEESAAAFQALMRDLYPEREESEEFINNVALLTEALEHGRLTAEQFDDAMTRLTEGGSEKMLGMADFAQVAFAGIEGGLAQMLRTGELSFSNFANAVIDDMIRMMIQAMIVGPVMKALGFASGGFVGGSVTPAPGLDLSSNIITSTGGASWGFSAGMSSGGYTGDGGKYEPAGIVHKGEGVLSQEEVRAIGGESGFNALRRAIRGPGHASGGVGGRPSLPPLPSSGSRAGGVNVTVNISDKGGAQVNAPAGYEDFARQIGEFVESKYRELEARSQRQGGVAWQARQGAF